MGASFLGDVGLGLWDSVHVWRLLGILRKRSSQERLAGPSFNLLLINVVFLTLADWILRSSLQFLAEHISLHTLPLLLVYYVS